MPPERLYPATERQTSEWEYCEMHKDYLGSIVDFVSVFHVDFDTLDHAFKQLLERHEGLRTIFLLHESVLQQKIIRLSEVEFDIEYIDISEVKYNSSQLQTIKEDFQNRRFDFLGTLFRLLLIKTSGIEYIVGIAAHHLISDDLSMMIIKRDLQTFYDCISSGLQHNLTALKFQMKEYALWEKEVNKSKIGIRNLEYWSAKSYKIRSCQKNVDALLTDFNDNNVGEVHEVFLNNDLLKAIKVIYPNIFVFILSVLSLLWSSFFSSNSVVFGVPLSSRDTSELEDVVGYLIYAIYLHIDLQSEINMELIYSQVSLSYDEAIRHRYYSRREPLADIDQYTNCLFNNLSSVVDDSIYDLNRLKKKISCEPPMFPFHVTLSSFKNGCLLNFRYQTRLIHSLNTIEMFDSFEKILNDSIFSKI